jgi:uncharacterized protein YuzE
VAGGVTRTVYVDPLDIGGLDLDRDGVSIGIEVMGASSKLPATILPR